jgi:hypothetical protein
MPCGCVVCAYVYMKFRSTFVPHIFTICPPAFVHFACDFCSILYQSRVGGSQLHPLDDDVG